MKIAILITSFNRIALTERCLTSVFNQSFENFCIDVFLVDDKSTDGTPEMVKNKFPRVNLIEGNGKLFWNRGMNLAFSHATRGDYDFFIWLNDDVLLYKNAISTVVELYKNLGIKESVIASAAIDSKTKEIAYTASKIRNNNPLKLIKVLPEKKPIECNTFNGNFVFIPRCVVDKIGINDPYFHHRMGDTDYGLSASRNGIKIFLNPEILCECDVNDLGKIYPLERKKILDRFRFLFSPKGLPFNEWVYINNKHNNLKGIFYSMLTYINIIRKLFINKRFI